MTSQFLMIIHRPTKRQYPKIHWAVSPSHIFGCVFHLSFVFYGLYLTSKINTLFNSGRTLFLYTNIEKRPSVLRNVNIF